MMGGVFLLYGFRPRFAGAAPVGGALGGLGKGRRLAGGEAAGFDGANTDVLLSGLTKLLTDVEHRRGRGGFHRSLRYSSRAVDEAGAFI